MKINKDLVDATMMLSFIILVLTRNKRLLQYVIKRDNNG